MNGKGREAAWRLRPPGSYARQQRPVDAEPEGPQWPVMVMLAGVFTFMLVFFTIGHRTLVSFTTIFRWFALFAIMGNFIPLRWYAKPLVMDRADWFWFNLVGVGPILLSLGLSINFFFHGPEVKMLVQKGDGFDLHMYWRTHKELPEHLPWPKEWGLDPMVDRALMERIAPDDVVFGLAQGSLGFWVITTRSVVHELYVPDGSP